MGLTSRQVFESVDELFKAAAAHIAERAVSAVKERGRFTLALSGGSTPRGVYGRLAILDLPWEDVHVFWGDERCVPPDHEDSNYRMARESLLERIGIPAGNVHRIEAELDPPAAAKACRESIQRAFAVADTDVPRFDLILLGMGPDGHTASLFPGTKALKETSSTVTENFVPQLKTTRVTFTFPLINAAREVLFLVAGTEKAGVLGKVMEGDPSYPSSLVQPEGALLWYLDRAAATSIKK